MRPTHRLARVNLDLVRSFLVVLEEGSINRAAARLHLAQSTLTRQIQALEHALGGRVLERTSTGVAPTAAGHALADGMRAILDSVDATLANARRLAQGQHDQLRIGYLLYATGTHLNPALAVLRRDHPEVKVKLTDLSPGEQIAALRAGSIDLAVTGQEGGSLGGEFYSRRLAQLPLLAVLPASHALAARPAIKLADLRDEIFVGSPERDMPGRNRWVTKLCRRAGFRARFGPEATSLAQAFSMVVSDHVVTIVPDYVQNAPAPGVVLRRISDAWATWDFIVLWQRGRAGPAVRAFLEALAATAAR
jgi:DNA-binding transcriptional LysR family regulator